MIHPSLAPGRAAGLAAKYLTRGQSGLVGFELKDEAEGAAAAGKCFIDALQLFVSGVLSAPCAASGRG